MYMRKDSKKELYYQEDAEGENGQGGHKKSVIGAVVSTLGIGVAALATVSSVLTGVSVNKVKEHEDNMKNPFR